MLKWLKNTAPRSWNVPPGTRVYAVGDIHGRADLLKHLLDLIAKDLHRGVQSTLVFLGDYIDRGPQSKQVLDCLLSPLPAPAIFIKGNHEESLERFFTEPEVWRGWSVYGGVECVLSYGVVPDASLKGAAYAESVRQQLSDLFPESHHTFLKQLRPAYELGDYFFCHAGVDPARPLAEQDAKSLLWMREPFLSHNKPLEKMVVHGHTITENAVFLPHRIGIDTGAYATGRLTALVLEGAERRLLSTINTY